MWLYVLIGLTIVVFVLGAARRAFRRGVRDEVVAYLKEHRPSWTVVRELPASLVLKAAGDEEIEFNLTRLFLAAAGIPNSNPDNRKPLYEQSLAALEEGIALQKPTLEAHGSRILPRLVPQNFLAGAPTVVRRALEGTPLHIVYVLDGAHGVSYITDALLQSLTLDGEGLHQRALANLQARFSVEVVQNALKGNMSVVKSEDTFDAARLLAVPSLLKEGEALAAVVSDRDTLVLAPVPADGDWAPMHKAARTYTGPLLLDVPLRVTRDGFETVR